MTIQMYGYSNIGTRKENEDSVRWNCESGSCGYAIVADGLGGHGGGAAASTIAADCLSLEENVFALPDREQIQRRIERANEEILSRRDGAWHMKTTAVALYIAQGQAVWTHTGDSRLYHFRDGELESVTIDQSMCQLHVFQGSITRSQIPEHPDRSKILYVLGDEKINPQIHQPVSLKPGQHVFLLCTDGLWERLREAEILIDLHKTATPEQFLEGLRVRADLRKSDDVDNNTAVAAFIEV